MNKFTLAILGLFMALFSSCQFSENIYINEDGSGRMEFSMDASELMKVAADMDDSNESGGPMGSDKAMDSTIVFREFLKEYKDSIATLSPAEQDKLKALENFKLHMVADPETNAMKFDLQTEFKNANELQDMFKAMNSFSNLQGKGGANPNDASNPFSSIGSDGATDVNYSYNNGIFKRSAKIINQELHQQAMDSIGEMGMMFSSSNYTLNYHFPKRIKSVSNENAMFSDDRKSFSLEVNFMETMKDPKLLDVEVILED